VDWPKLKAGFAEPVAGAVSVAGFSKEVVWPKPKDGFLDTGSSGFGSGVALESPNLNVGAGAGVEEALVEVAPKLNVGALEVAD